MSPATIYRTIAECEQGIPCLDLQKCRRPKALSMATPNRLIETAKNRVDLELHIKRTIAECEQGIPCLDLQKSGRPKALSRATPNKLIETAKNRVDLELHIKR
ncbi:hypothetical protein ILUMI_23556 [Ignelater luminosus]|uniref:Uncharacterized protein n=1 Tax=Ignelater luminosus TaxID=2038154 RepID=A0A8K0CDP4_IGNLU|nr:hypothetical protein ILUMI_23556 [Ignelater luminosus]